MKNASYIITLLVLFIIAGCSGQTQEKGRQAVKIIFDTDLGPDYDDVGALAFLHAMADSGKAEILATVSSNRHELVVPSIDVINTWFNRPGLPIGAPMNDGASMGSSQHWADSLVARYPHAIKLTSDAEDAVKVYRRILAGQPDNSVTIITVGFLTNLRNLLQSAPDDISPLTGIQLIGKKVSNLVSMAGSFPEGREFNVYIDPAASKYVFENWPGEVVFTGFEIGKEILTGLRVMDMPIAKSPVKDVFRISIPLSEEDRNGRMSWDETAVLIAVYGTDGFFDTRRGTIQIDETGNNKWIDNSEGKHQYVIRKMPVPEITKFIEDRMMHVPSDKK